MPLRTLHHPVQSITYISGWGMAATTRFPLPHSGFAARALHTGMSPKSESVPGVSLCYTTRFPSLLYCDVLWQYSKRSFNLSFHINKSLRQYLCFELFLLSSQVSPGENEDVGIFLQNKGNSKEFDHVENFVLESWCLIKTTFKYKHRHLVLFKRNFTSPGSSRGSPEAAPARPDRESMARPFSLACITHQSCFCFLAHSDLHCTSLTPFFCPLYAEPESAANRSFLSGALQFCRCNSSPSPHTALGACLPQSFIFHYWDLSTIQSTSGQHCLFVFSPLCKCK